MSQCDVTEDPTSNFELTTDDIQGIAADCPPFLSAIHRDIDHSVRTAYAETFDDVMGPLIEAVPDTPETVRLFSLCDDDGYSNVIVPDDDDTFDADKQGSRWN